MKFIQRIKVNEKYYKMEINVSNEIHISINKYLEKIKIFFYRCQDYEAFYLLFKLF